MFVIKTNFSQNRFHLLCHSNPVGPSGLIKPNQTTVLGRLCTGLYGSNLNNISNTSSTTKYK
ncbi:unnamed protein product, partial [Vitis vinifera]